jgi:uncharacterized protein (TIGR02246 family)
MNQEITNLLEAYEKALNSSDPKAAMALYGSDPIFMAQNADVFIGREAVQASYQHIFQTIKLNVVFTIHEIVEMGDLAYGRTTSAGQQEVLATCKMSREANNELFIFRREEGQWKIQRLPVCHLQPARGELMLALLYQTPIRMLSRTERIANFTSRLAAPKRHCMWSS